MVVGNNPVSVKDSRRCLRLKQKNISLDFYDNNQVLSMNSHLTRRWSFKNNNKIIYIDCTHTKKKNHPKTYVENYWLSPKIIPKFSTSITTQFLFYGGARGVIVIVVGNWHGARVQILDQTNCISHSTNTLGKGMNPIILPPAMGK